MSRSEIIRDLSIPISYLQWVTRPGDGNYAACSEVSRTLAWIVDEAVDPHSSPTSEQPTEPMLMPAKNEDVVAPIEDQIMLE